MATIKDKYILEIDTGNATQGLSNVQSGMGGVAAGAGRLKGLLGPLAAAFAAIGVVSVVGDKINEFDELAKSARAAGAAASNEAFEGFQVLKQAMNEAGIDAGTFDRAMLNTSQRLQKGMEGAKGFSDIFDKLGDSVKDTNGDLAAGPELLQAMINGLNEGTISTDEFAKVVGGRAGPLIQQQFASINGSAEQLQATLEDVAANSNIVSLDAAENAEVFNDNIGRLKESMGQLLTDAITPLLPILVELSEKVLANMPAVIEKVKAGFAALEPVFSLVGTVLTELVFPILQKVFEVLGMVASAITPLVEFLLPGIKAAFEGIVAVVEGVVAAFNRVVETLTNIGNKVSELTGAVGDRFSSMKDGAVNAARDTYDGVTGFFGDMYDEVVGNSIVPDMVKGVLGEMGDMEGGMIGFAKSAAQGVAGALSTIGDSLGFNLGDSITQGIRGATTAVSEFATQFGINAGTIRNTADSVSRIVSNMFGQSDQFGELKLPNANSLSSIAQTASSTAITQLPVNRPQIVRQVMPENAQTQGSMVNYNINAVDALSFKQLLARDPEFLHSLVLSQGRFTPRR